MARGDRVLLFTDGVVEAMAPNGDMFGVDRLSALVAAGEGDVDALLSAVVREVSAFSGRGTSSPEDDCTLVALEIT